MVSVYGIDNVENFRIILFCDFSLPSETDDIDIQSLVDKMYLVGQYGRVLMNLTVQVMNHGIDLYRAEEKRQSLEDIYLSMVKEAGL